MRLGENVLTNSVLNGISVKYLIKARKLENWNRISSFQAQIRKQITITLKDCVLHKIPPPSSDEIGQLSSKYSLFRYPNKGGLYCAWLQKRRKNHMGCPPCRTKFIRICLHIFSRLCACSVSIKRSVCLITWYLKTRTNPIKMLLDWCSKHVLNLWKKDATWLNKQVSVKPNANAFSEMFQILCSKELVS